MSKTFAERLNRLFATVYPPGRGPHSNAEVIAELRAEDHHMSAPYLSQLRRGNRVHPSPETVAALAGFFRVDPRYFTDDARCAQLDQELDVLVAMRDQGIQYIASRIAGLSPTAQDDVAATVERLRRKEHLDAQSDRGAPTSA